MRAFLLFLSRREGLKNFALKFKFLRKVAWRFVAGETIDDAIRAVRENNQLGIRCSLDLLGEYTLVHADAERTTIDIIGMLDRIRTEGVQCNVSVKLTQLGLALDSEFCGRNLTSIIMRARELDNFIRVDMEESRYTSQTLELVLRARREFENVGAVIQAYLYRSERDVRTLIANRTRVRLCKGAYLEPDTIAFKKKRDTDANYILLMKILLDSDLYHAIATHDEAMIAAAKEHARSRGIAKNHFEFQMLYGIRRDLQEQLAREGYNVRVYVPYGRRWYPYLMRRLAERPANLFFVARNIFMHSRRDTPILRD
jgi:proline dehydrogenase